MKVLFAVNNDEISNAIVKRYQKDYKEILSYKNVYYFNAILKELQKDKTYDRVVISEDLEPFANNNYDTIDKFLFEKLDSISDEAIDAEGNDTDVILICTDRRSKSDDMLVKLFGIGIYSAMIGQDRSIEEVCKLINKPRTKKEAKQYYKIEIDNVGYQAESEDSVSEAEVQNILAHYKRLGRNEDKYVDSFNNIVSQYTDTQLKIIIRYLPISVKAVLEERSPKYQQLVSFDEKSSTQNLNKYSNKMKKTSKDKQESGFKVEMLDNESTKTKITKPIIIPSGVNTTQVKRLIKQEKPRVIPEPAKIDKTKIENEFDFEEIEKTLESSEAKETLANPPKRGRGRPRKNPLPDVEQELNKPKRGRGRPRKTPVVEENTDEQQDDELIDLFDLEDEIINTPDVKNTSNVEDELDLFSLAEEEAKEEDNEEELIDLFNIDDEINENESTSEEINNSTTDVAETQYRHIDTNFNTLLTKDKKIVSFVGTTKNGTSFIVNNAAHMLASMGIQTAILDMTKTRNAYYIYTNSEEKLMETAKKSIYKLRSGIAEGIRINKNLDVYTTVPDDNSDYSDVDSILSTLLKNYSVVLIDCDFDTPIEYFGASQEIYLVQSMDVLTIQPLTAFLRDLQAKGVLRQEKLRIIINKSVNIRSVPIKTLIGGISKYNDPSLTVMKDLFDKDKVSYCVVPFELQNYTKYLDSLITCTVSLNGYTKALITSLRELCNMIYPLINKQVYSPRGDKYKDNFSNEMNNTLNKMKKKYQ